MIILSFKVFSTSVAENRVPLTHLPKVTVAKSVKNFDKIA